MFNNSFDFVVAHPAAAQFYFDGRNLVLWGDGYDQYLRINSLTVAEAAQDAGSWASGEDVMKYMVTIGQSTGVPNQPIPYPGYYMDGYWFGANGTTPTIELRGFYAAVLGTSTACSFGQTNGQCNTGDQLDYELVPDDPSHTLIQGPYFTGQQDGPAGQFAYRVGIQLDDPPGAPCTLDPNGYCAVFQTFTRANYCTAGDSTSYNFTETTKDYIVYGQNGVQQNQQFTYIINDPWAPCAIDGWIGPEPAQYFNDPYLP